MGAPQAPSLNGPLDSRRGQANRGGLKLDGGMSEGNLGLFCVNLHIFRSCYWE